MSTWAPDTVADALTLPIPFFPPCTKPSLATLSLPDHRCCSSTSIAISTRQFLRWILTESDRLTGEPLPTWYYFNFELVLFLRDMVKYWEILDLLASWFACDWNEYFFVANKKRSVVSCWCIPCWSVSAHFRSVWFILANSS